MKHDVKFWWLQRVTAVCLIPVTMYLLLFAFFCIDVTPIYELGSVAGMNSHSIVLITELIARSPFFVTVFILCSLYHGALGMQVIIEDYINCASLRTCLITALYVASVLTALAALFIVFSLVF